MVKKEKDWSCFQCNFAGTEKEVEDHKCPTEKAIEQKTCLAQVKEHLCKNKAYKDDYCKKHYKMFKT